MQGQLVTCGTYSSRINRKENSTGPGVQSPRLESASSVAQIMCDQGVETMKLLPARYDHVSCTTLHNAPCTRYLSPSVTSHHLRQALIPLNTVPLSLLLSPPSFNLPPYVYPLSLYTSPLPMHSLSLYLSSQLCTFIPRQQPAKSMPLSGLIICT